MAIPFLVAGERIRCYKSTKSTFADCILSVRRDTSGLIILLRDIQEFEERMISEGPAYEAQFALLDSDYS